MHQSKIEFNTKIHQPKIELRKKKKKKKTAGIIFVI